MVNLCATFTKRLEIVSYVGCEYLDAFDRYMSQPWDPESAAILDKLEEEWEKTQEYQCFVGHQQQQQMVEEIDYLNQIDAKAEIKWWDICQAKEASGRTCGCFMMADLWKKLPDKWRFYCRTDWDRQRERDRTAYIMNAAYFGEEDNSKWPKFGCGARFIPFARGASKLVQMELPDGSDIFFLAERPPALIDDTIKMHQASWNKALNDLTPAALQKLLPKCYPDKRFAPPNYEGLLGVGYFDIDEHMKGEGKLVLTMEGWGILLMNVAVGNLEDLGDIFTLGMDMHQRPTAYAVGSSSLPKTASDINIDQEVRQYYEDDLQWITEGTMNLAIEGAKDEKGKPETPPPPRSPTPPPDWVGRKRKRGKR